MTTPSFRLWRFTDLRERGIVTSRAMLKIMVEQYGFPPGKMLTPNSRVWTQAEVVRYYESRSSELKDTSYMYDERGRPKRKRGRPKTKHAAAEAAE